MTLNRGKGLFLLVALILLLTAGCAKQPAFRARQGVLDLAGWNPEQHGTAALDGEWEFFWQQLLTPQELEREGTPAPLLALPGGWNQHQVEGAKLPADGYATFRLRVRLPEAGRPYSLQIRYMSTAYRLWVDGKLVAGNGVVGTAPDQMVPQFLPATVQFVPEQPTVELVVQVSNYHHRVGGIWPSPTLGSSSQMARRQFLSTSLAAALFGSILIMSVYHLVLYYLHRRDRSALFLSLVCLMIAMRILVTDEFLLLQVLPDFPWPVHLRMEYLTGYLSLVFILAFLRSLYPREMLTPVDRTLQGIALAAALVTLIVPVRLSSLLIPPYELLVAGSVLYMSAMLIRAAVRRREGAYLILAGCSVLFATILLELLQYNQILLIPRLMSLGLLILLLVQSAVVAGRFSAAFWELQRSRRLLIAREEHLRREIAEMLHGRVQTRLLITEYRLGEAERLCTDGLPEAADLLRTARAQIAQVREEDVRQASHLLHPTIIRVGLVPAARALAEQFTGHFQVDVTVDPRLSHLDDSLANGIPEPCRLAAYRVLEEALGNAVAHANASRIEIWLGLSERGDLTLRVTDNGRGMDTATIRPGLGLQAIAARVGERGGHWEIGGRPGAGTVLYATLPLSAG